MNEEQIKITDESNDRKYFSIIPHYVVNHSTVYEQSLYLVMKRVAGENGSCWASPKEISNRMGVSANTVRKNIKKLLDRKWIRLAGQKQIGRTGQYVNEYKITDLWKENIKYIESEVVKSSRSETLKSSPGELKSSPRGNKEETKKNNITVSLPAKQVNVDISDEMIPVPLLEEELPKRGANKEAMSLCGWYRKEVEKILKRPATEVIKGGYKPVADTLKNHSREVVENILNEYLDNLKDYKYIHIGYALSGKNISKFLNQ